MLVHPTPACSPSVNAYRSSLIQTLFPFKNRVLFCSLLMVLETFGPLRVIACFALESVGNSQDNLFTKGGAEQL